MSAMLLNLCQHFTTQLVDVRRDRLLDKLRGYLPVSVRQNLR